MPLEWEMEIQYEVLEVLLLIFRKEKHYNYANEGFNLLAHTVLLSPRQVSEISWSCTIDTRGE